MTESIIDYRALQFWLSVAQVVGYLILGAYVWIVNRQKATRAEIKELRDSLASYTKDQADNCGKHKARTTTLEVKVENSPSHEDLGKVYDRINVVKGAVDEMSGTLKGIGTQVGLLVRHHMGEGKS